MIFILICLVLIVGLAVGWISGCKYSRDGLRMARYRDAIALADDLIKTPDALDLRERAQKILAAHRKEFPKE